MCDGLVYPLAKSGKNFKTPLAWLGCSDFVLEEDLSKVNSMEQEHEYSTLLELVNFQEM